MKTAVKYFVTIIFVAAFSQGCSTPQINKPADLLYKEGEQLYLDGKYEDAIAQWKKVKDTYQSPELNTKAELNIADAYFLNKDYIEAAAGYEDFRKLHPKHPQADFALYRQGMSYYNQIHSIDTDQTPVKNAQSTFASYLSHYPEGAQRTEVQEKSRDCRDKQLQYELYVARFYMKNDSYKAAIARFEESLKMLLTCHGVMRCCIIWAKPICTMGRNRKGVKYSASLLLNSPAVPTLPRPTRRWIRSFSVLQITRHPAYGAAVFLRLQLRQSGTGENPAGT